ncbi:MAG TPA: alpha,alpha-trehalase TreF [Steroidobacteraceae bacterium]|nr:alpha,alpha-trehalase TreF [Steroidobacteraceae bacterium]
MRTDVATHFLRTLATDMFHFSNRFLRSAFLAIVSSQIALCSVVANAREAVPPPPSQVYGALFQRVQSERIFADSKTFADAVAKAEPPEIMRRYAALKDLKEFSLRDFVADNFIVPGGAGGDFKTTPREEIRAHIDRLWIALTREPQEAPGASSLLPLRTRYVVPGGRFREMYYWDSYFTMVGLQTSGRDDLVAAMVENFAGLIDDYGHIPNGNRSYYLGRSQPPFFAAMVELQAQRDGTSALIKRLPQLEREYEFWMEGAKDVSPGAAHRRVVRFADGSLLNRYWDDWPTPRDEAYLEDTGTARSSGRPETEVYRDLRASAESGWDFSSRWFADGKTLRSIRTTNIVPVDLNSLLYKLELVIARGCKAAQRPDCSKSMLAHARERQSAMFKLMWDENLNAFVDYDWRDQARLAHLTAATAYPLFAGLVDRKRAHRIAQTLKNSLLMPHGLATTTEDTGQQWDAPNGWAPLQWVAIDGLRRNGEAELAAKIAEVWVAENVRVYCRTGKLVEKYNVRDAGEGAGGEYPVQDGFGWTNAVVIKLLAIYPKLGRPRYEFTGGGC